MTLSEFRRVRTRIQPYIRSTPVVPCDIPNLFLKLENLQYTHSFKIRGAFAKMLDVVEHNDRRTILTVSAGNHGQAVARAASTFKLPCTVVVPSSTPNAKVEAIRNYGIDLRIEGANYDEAEAWTLKLAENTQEYVFVSPYNDALVVLGQGTLAFEILEQCPDVETIVLSIGGGGLAAGVAAAAKQIRPSIRIIGIQAEVSAAIYYSLKAGHIVTIPDVPSIADGIQGNIDLHTMTFEWIQKYVDEVVLVSEKSIKSSILHLLHQEKLLTEGSAAICYAAATEGSIPLNGPAVAIISGGNIDLHL